MKMMWSPSVGGFFGEDSSHIPEDAVEVDESMWSRMMEGQLEGKIIVNGPDDLPVLEERPGQGPEEYRHQARLELADLRRQGLEHIESMRWRDKAVMNRLGEEEKQEYNAWLDWLDALDSTDISGAPDVVWPVMPVTVVPEHPQKKLPE